MTRHNQYEVYAIRYAERLGRTRQDSFVLDPHHATPHAMDYFVWLVRNAERTILVDTGYDQAEAAARGRGIMVDPCQALADIGVDPGAIDTVIITHLHYDHAGGLANFPKARLHLQEREMSYATGPCMCHDFLRAPYTAEHICDAVRRVHRGQVHFHDGDGEVAAGVTVHWIGGHTGGLQSVRVDTAAGPVVLASDASHYYENYERERPFPLVVNVADMLNGFRRLRTLAGDGGIIVPGHDPLVRERFPRAFEGSIADIRRIDTGPR